MCAQTQVHSLFPNCHSYTQFNRFSGTRRAFLAVSTVDSGFQELQWLGIVWRANSHSPMERQSNTTGERSGAGPTALRAFRDTGVSHHQVPTTDCYLEIPNNTFCPIWESNLGPHTQDRCLLTRGGTFPCPVVNLQPCA